MCSTPKSMVLSNMARKECTVGEMVNLISVNVQSLNEFSFHFNMTWSCLISIIVGTYLIWQQLGVASLAGLSVMIVMLPLNVFMSNQAKKLQLEKLKHTDARVKTINEWLNGAKVVKLYAWEVPFSQLINRFRNEEIRVLRKISYFGIVSNLSWFITPFLVCLILVFFVDFSPS